MRTAVLLTQHGVLSTALSLQRNYLRGQITYAKQSKGSQPCTAPLKHYTEPQTQFPSRGGLQIVP